MTNQSKPRKFTHRHRQQLDRAAEHYLADCGKQLEYAERLLTITPLPVREIARRAGFGTTSTFNRCFRQRHGITPTGFREVRKCEPRTP